jgi:hypothetical protein
MPVIATLRPEEVLYAQMLEPADPVRRQGAEQSGSYRFETLPRVKLSEVARRTQPVQRYGSELP